MKDTRNEDMLRRIDAEDYRGMHLTGVAIAVDDALVDGRIRELLAKVSLEPLGKSPIEKGDIVRLSYKGTIDAETPVNLSDDKCTVVIGSGTMVSGFEEAIVGHRVGDCFSVNLTMPALHVVEALQGKNARFTVGIAQAMREQDHELTDEYIAQKSEFETVDELRAAVREQLERESKEETTRHLKGQVADELVKMVGGDATGDKREQAFESAWHMVAHKEKLWVDDSDIADEVDVLVQVAGVSPEEAVEQLEDSSYRKDIIEFLLCEKTIAYLIANAEIADVGTEDGELSCSSN